MNEYQETHERGDFLIRNVMGADRESGAVAINANPPGSGRPSSSSSATRRPPTTTCAPGSPICETRCNPTKRCSGALLCSCNGRGRGLFREPDHDAAALSEIFGPTPTAGFFCNGEIGPVGGENYLHGFTASIAVLTAGGSGIGSD